MFTLFAVVSLASPFKHENIYCPRRLKLERLATLPSPTSALKLSLQTLDRGKVGAENYKSQHARAHSAQAQGDHPASWPASLRRLPGSLARLGLGAAARGVPAGAKGGPGRGTEKDATGGVGGGALGRLGAGQAAPQAPQCRRRRRRPGGWAREPCNPAAGSGQLRPSPAPGLARQRGHDEEAV